jgi:hypothetical protein
VEDRRLAERKLPVRPLLFREAPEFRGIPRRGTGNGHGGRKTAERKTAGGAGNSICSGMLTFRALFFRRTRMFRILAVRVVLM